ncbi:dicarboxylate/amino acid:cation symporter [candidate division TA06 bacterium]|nr:dicarboxylate/amino acid:cation symporter [candidate division TA06 bacterium]
MGRFNSQTYLLWGVLAGVILGGVVGWVFGPKALFLSILGELFLNALKALVIPLIVVSMIVGISHLGDVRRLGRLGGITLLYFLTTMGLSVILGILLVNWIQPGVGVTIGEEMTKVLPRKEYSFLNVLRGLIPPNLFQAMSEGQVLPLLLFSLLFGGILTTLGPSGESVILFFRGINDALLKMVRIVMFFAPIGVFSLVATRLAQAGGGEMFLQELLRIFKYAGTVILGLLIHGSLTLPLVLFLFTRKNPLKVFKGVSQALMTAFATASSSATLPVTLEKTRSNLKTSPEVSSFVLPLGATINMDGTALYEAIAAIFIAQIYGIPLTLGQEVVIFLTATLAAIGAAGIPEAGLVTMVLVLQSVGLPLEGIGALLAIDWFLDRCRTTVNVWGDVIGTGVIDSTLGKRS